VEEEACPQPLDEHRMLSQCRHLECQWAEEESGCQPHGSDPMVVCGCVFGVCEGVRRRRRRRSGSGSKKEWEWERGEGVRRRRRRGSEGGEAERETWECGEGELIRTEAERNRESEKTLSLSLSLSINHHS
jgi:hypothetical protein